MALEEIDCPKSRVVSSVGVGLAGPRAVSPPGRARISRAHSTAGVTANAAGADVRNAAAAAATAATTSASAADATATDSAITASNPGTSLSPSKDATKAVISGGMKSRSASLSPPKLRAGASKITAGKKEAAAAAAAVRRLYRVREAGGVQATRTPDIVAPTIDVIQAGTAFYGIAEVGSGSPHIFFVFLLFTFFLFLFPSFFSSFSSVFCVFSCVLNLIALTPCCAVLVLVLALLGRFFCENIEVTLSSVRSIISSKLVVASCVWVLARVRVILGFVCWGSCEAVGIVEAGIALCGSAEVGFSCFCKN